MKGETIVLIGIGISLVGFLTGLAANNMGHQKKTTLKSHSFFKYLTSISIVLFLVLAFLYQILYS